MDITTAARAAAFWSGLHLLLLLVLSVQAVRQRRRFQIALGEQGPSEMTQAIRAFGNAAEYVPAGVVAMLVLVIAGAPAALVHLAGFSLFAGRVAHAVGLLRNGGASALRSVGMLMTWLSYLGAAVSLLFFAIP
ncbi:MAPEG family protein [Phenylobacterium immobile]|uniref:MAPEG family protein n=1 Tax=Phenylobacterium immobile TaxID=21 RepID=UPI000A57C7BD|nr:MAPEG family protein [Phenylobacterium immobile]